MAVYHVRFEKILVLCAIISISSTLPDERIIQDNASVICLNETTFTTKGNIGSFVVVLDKVLACPAGYICDDKTIYPCIPPGPITTSPDTTTTPATTTPIPYTTTTPVTTTPVPYTTTTPVTTPIPSTTTEESVTVPGVPACYGHSYWPGPTCDKYYECVSKWWWYEPQMRDCQEGYYFSKTERTCVPAEESGCP